MYVLKGLNNKQKEAVTAIDGNIRVTAGAGSGKTRVLAHRYAFLVNEVGISPSNILCMTFTNKAAQEMKKRISTMVHEGNVNDFVCTIHGFCVKFLREEIFRIGYPKNFSIIDQEDCKDLAKQVMGEFCIDKTVETVKQFLTNIRKNKYWTPYIKEYMCPNCSTDGTDEFHRYLHLQLKSFSLDFDDLILYTLYILENDEPVRTKWQERLNYIMVDEAQDCNGHDWELIELLRGNNHNLFFVGDPDQCIYEWRGANPNQFINFKPDTDIILSQNYRSTPNILDVANSIISHNKNRIKKDLFTEQVKGKKVIYYHAPSEVVEGNWIAKQIDNMVKNGSKNSDFAILYRASYLSRFIEQSLLQNHIEYTIWGGVRFFERKEIKDAVSYLKLLVYHDDISFKRIINVPSRKFGPKSITKLATIADKENRSLFETLEEHHKEFNNMELSKFLSLYQQAGSYKENHSISDTLDFLLANSGYKELLRLDEDQDRIDNLEELLSSIKYYETVNKEEENLSIDNYLQDVALFTNADFKKDTPTVKLMTIHQAKGLEFPYVFVCGLTEGIFPSHRSIRERKEKALEEERRLMYVAVTRAEKALFLTDSEGYNYVTKTEKFPSRFLSEIQDNLIHVEGNIIPSLVEGTKEAVLRLQEELGVRKNNNFTIGSIVNHKYFGVGEVVNFNNDDNSYKVRFNKETRTVSGWSLTNVSDKNVLKHKEINDKSVIFPYIYVCEWSYFNDLKKKIGIALKSKLISQKNETYNIGSYKIPMNSVIYQNKEGKYYKIYYVIKEEDSTKYHIGAIVSCGNNLYQIIKILKGYVNVSHNKYLLASLKEEKTIEKEEGQIEKILFTPSIGGCLKSSATKDYYYLKSIQYKGLDTTLIVIDSEKLKEHKYSLDKMLSLKVTECTEATFLKHCDNKKKFHEIANKLQKNRNNLY